MFPEVIRRNRWGTLSLLITVVSAVTIYSLVRFFHSHGLWGASPRLQTIVGIAGTSSLFLSFGSAALGVAKDSSRVLAALALCLSLLSFFFYVQ